MPDIGQLFPSRYLSFQELTPGELHTGTILRVVAEQARATFTFGRAQQPMQQVEASYVLWFQEYPKPLKLRKSRAQVIAALVGSKNTDHWPGHKISFYRGITTIGGEPIEGILIDQTPVPRGPVLPAAAPAWAFKATGRMIVPEKLNDFRQRIAGLGKTWDDFIGWVRLNDAHAFASIWGQGFDQLDSGIIHTMKRYLDHLAASQGPPGATPGAAPPPPVAALPASMPPVANHVFTPPSARSVPSWGPPAAPISQELDPDDIPF